MNPSALVFLETREARMLAAAWPMFRKEFPTGDHSQHLDRDDRDFGGWLAMASCPDDTSHESLASSIRNAGICRDDGTLDPLAEWFIADAALSAVGISTPARTGIEMAHDIAPKERMIKNSEVSVRLRRILEGMGVDTWEQAALVDLDQLRMRKTCGNTTLREFVSAVAAHTERKA